MVVAPVVAQVSVLTEHNDVSRTGQNTNEVLLSPANVNVNQFGKLFRQATDGYIVGQPLYLSGVLFPDGLTHNVVYVATQHDSVYAFDADSNSGGNAAPLWYTSFISPAAGVTSVPISDHGCTGTRFREIGITSTPVIDPLAGTLYVVAKTIENGTHVFRLHALDVATGLDKLPPTVISATVPNAKGTMTFNPTFQMQRPALLLSNGGVYIGFGSNGCDTFAYHGWLLAYDATTLQQLAAFSTTPNGRQGAIWQAGGGPAADTDGTIFFASGNGTFDASNGGIDYGDSIVHLQLNGNAFTVLDYFTPYNQQFLADNDLDLGAGGIALLPDQDAPHTHDVIGGGKEGTVYVVDRDNMGRFNATSDRQIVQSIPGVTTGELTSVPTYWNGSVYLSGEGDFIKQFTVSNDMLSSQPVSQTPSVFNLFGPGTPSISSTGSNRGILWAIKHSATAATLYAFDATNLANQLYASSQATKGRDALNGVANFIPPTIANGKVYIGGTAALTVYGLLPTITPTAGNNQVAVLQTTLPVPLTMFAADAYVGAAIPSVTVTCKDGGVGGIFSNPTMITDTTGRASTTYTLPKKIVTITITCTAPGLTPVAFTETSTAGPPAKQVIVSGNEQKGAVSTPLPLPLVVKVQDANGYRVTGALVTFSDGGVGGRFSATTATTDSTGQARTSYTPPGTTGTVYIIASVPGVKAVIFTETVQ